MPKGLENPVRSQDIADRVGLITKREVMAVIGTLIVDFDIPIGG